MTIISLVVSGRALTPEEDALEQNLLAAAESAGTTSPTGAWDPKNWTIIKIWTTTDAANAYVSLWNSFTPAITSAQVLTI